MSLVEAAWCATTPRRHSSADDANVGSGLKSVGSALDVLECFATDGELGVSDIARRLGVAKSTAHRLLQTLVSRGFVEQDSSTGQYRLGIHLYELGQLAVARNELRHAALPTLRQVAQTTGLTVNFSVPDGADVASIEALRDWLAALAVYRDEVGESLAGVQIEVRRGLEWVAEQLALWQRAVRDCEEEVTQRKAELAQRGKTAPITRFRASPSLPRRRRPHVSAPCPVVVGCRRPTHGAVP